MVNAKFCTGSKLWFSKEGKQLTIKNSSFDESLLWEILVKKMSIGIFVLFIATRENGYTVLRQPQEEDRITI